MAAVVGIVLLCAGGLLAMFAVSRPIGVGGVVNLGLMSDRISLLIGASAVALMGAAFLCANAVVGAVRSLQETIRIFERHKYDS